MAARPETLIHGQEVRVNTGCPPPIWQKVFNCPGALQKVAKSTLARDTLSAHNSVFLTQSDIFSLLYTTPHDMTNKSLTKVFLRYSLSSPVVARPCTLGCFAADDPCSRASAGGADGGGGAVPAAQVCAPVGGSGPSRCHRHRSGSQVDPRTARRDRRRRVMGVGRGREMVDAVLFRCFCEPSQPNRPKSRHFRPGEPVPSKTQFSYPGK